MKLVLMPSVTNKSPSFLFDIINHMVILLLREMTLCSHKVRLSHS